MMHVRSAQHVHRAAGLVADHLPLLQRLVGRVEVMSARRFGRTPLSVVFGTPVLVLETVGRRSGRRRSTTLAFGPVVGTGHSSSALVIIGGAGGQRRLPDWVANLRATPRANIWIDGVRREVVANEVKGVERSTMWPRLVEQWPQIVWYDARLDRDIPVFILDSPQ